MPIDREKALGAELEGGEFTWDADRLILYALGVGIGVNQNQVDPKKVLQYTYENGLKALPTFGVVPVFGAIGNLISLPGLDINLMMLLHGEQYTEIVKSPLPINAKVISSGKVTGIYDKVKGALLVMDVDSKDADTGEIMIKNTFSAYIRGEGGFGKPDDPKAPEPGNEPPDREPDKVIEYPTMTHQAILYRLSGDKNPLHIDPEMAKMGGFDVPILHGLCTYGNVGRAVIEAYTDNNPEKFKSIKVRFSKPVFPGETIVVQMWKESNTEIICKAKAKERDIDVITNAKVTLTG
ncbi:MAG: MaoC/PaaZ C-terminal domain-containing protein [Spirochaetota bacterium]|nr:MaoC/PaaZ C-terminal domain-containing protein [Spirochaetota bacterium]